MKTALLFSILLGATLTAFAADAPTESRAASGAIESASGSNLAAEQAAPLLLRVNLKPGARYRTRIEVQTDDSTTAGPNKERYVQNAWLQYESQVVRIESGVAILRASFNSIGIEVGDGRTTTVFDSRRARPSTGKPGSAQRQAQDDLSNVVKGIAGETCSYSISPDGKRIVIRDLEAALQRIIVRMKLRNKTRDVHLKGIMRDMLKGFLGNTDKPNQLTGLYPRRSVNVGDTWKESYVLQEGPAPMKSVTNFALQDRQNGIAFIALGGPLSASPARITDKRISDIRVSGWSRGRVQIKEGTGWIISSSTQVQSTVRMDVNVGRKIRVTKSSKGSVVVTSSGG